MMHGTHPLRRALAAAALLAALAAAGPTLAAKPERPLGFVDKQMFLDLLPTEDPVRVEVNIPKPLIQALCAGVEQDLKRVACGLDSIEALILEVTPTLSDRITGMMNDVDRDLQRKGWSRIVLVRDHDEHVRVLILNAEQQIHGLVVMVLDSEQMVFVNVAGLIDLQAMQQIAGEWNIPGLEHLDEYENENQESKPNK